jgi:hypothetical protein
LSNPSSGGGKPLFLTCSILPDLFYSSLLFHLALVCLLCLFAA